MDARGLVAGRIRFNDIPVEQREGLVEVGGAVEVGSEHVGALSVAVPDVNIEERNA